MSKSFFLDMQVVNIGNAENMFIALVKCLISRQNPLSNVVSFVSDNCSVMKDTGDTEKEAERGKRQKEDSDN